MNCRRPTALAAAVLAAITLAARPTPARADVMNPGFDTYRLTSDTAVPSASNDPLTHPVAGGPPVPQVVFSTIPQNGIAPPEVPAAAGGSVQHASPLTVLDSSSGIDQSSNGFVAVGLRPGTNPDGSADQLFGLSFFSKDLPVGLKSAADGGHLDFKLRVDKSLAAPTFTVDPSSLYKGLHITQLDVPPPTPPPTPPAPPVVPQTPPPTPTTPPTTAPTALATPPPNTPEPMSLALWSVLSGVGLLRARAYRRRKADATA